MKKLLKRPLTWVITGIVVLLILFIGFGGSAGETQVESFVIARTDVAQEVKVSGTVKPAESVDLAFEKTGKIARIYADVGAQVVQGQTLVVLENSDALAQLNQAEAEVKAEEAKLAELKRGTRSEELTVQNNKVQAAQLSYEDAKRNLIDKIQDAYSKADDAVHAKTDQFFSDTGGANFNLTFTPNNSQLEIDTNWQRVLAEQTLDSWYPLLGTLSSSDLTSTLSTVEKNLSQIKFFLDKAWLSVNGALLQGTLTQATVNEWKVDIATAQSNVNTAISNLTAAREKLRSAEADLAVAKSELVVDEAGTVPEQILAQEAQLQKVAANRDYYRAQLGKTILRAPISGVVTKQEAKLGEIVSANTVITSIISAGNYEIEANLPEADIAKVQVGNKALVTLDAYGSEIVFEVIVVSIDPAETLIDGIATYKIKFQFVGTDERVRSGMTASITISGEQRLNVIAVPQRAVVIKNGNKTVEVKRGEENESVTVKTGLRGSNGLVEIIEGLSEGETVVISQ